MKKINIKLFMVELEKKLENLITELRINSYINNKKIGSSGHFEFLFYPLKQLILLHLLY